MNKAHMSSLRMILNMSWFQFLPSQVMLQLSTGSQPGKCPSSRVAPAKETPSSPSLPSRLESGPQPRRRMLLAQRATATSLCSSWSLSCSSSVRSWRRCDLARGCPDGSHMGPYAYLNFVSASAPRYSGDEGLVWLASTICATQKFLHAWITKWNLFVNFFYEWV